MRNIRNKMLVLGGGAYGKRMENELEKEEKLIKKFMDFSTIRLLYHTQQMRKNMYYIT